MAANFRKFKELEIAPYFYVINMKDFAPFQHELLNTIKKNFDKPIPEAIEAAFLATPRHQFVRKYFQQNGKVWEAVIIDETNLDLKLPLLYQDNTIPLMVDHENDNHSSISQPSFVLHMLDKLRLDPGHRVLEIGAASGWNAALMGALVGEKGHVCSVEIHPELANSAREVIAAQGVTNVEIIEGDGGEGYPAAAPYDRIMFTVGSYDLPAAFYRQIKDGGLLLMVIKNKGFGDNLFLFKKVEGHFVAIDSVACAFVSMQGKYRMSELRPIDITSIPFWQEIKDEIVARKPFWCGGKSLNNRAFLWKALGLISFLGIVEPSFEAFKVQGSDGDREKLFFGVLDTDTRSIAVFNDEDKLIGYGNTTALDRLRRQMQLWFDLGMPGASCFKLEAYPIGTALRAGSNQWITQRRDTKYLWTLDV
jgi:protein-L-isoaspartate(D-aspartate) O-methyltransferase